MIPLGWWLNGYYYLLRYESEGFNQHIKWILAVGLVIFASACFSAAQFFKTKNNKTGLAISILIYIILALYSINCTTAGQYWEQQKKTEETTISVNEKENQKELVEMYKNNIKIAEDELIILNDVKYSSIDDMSDRWYYNQTTGKVEKKQDELQARINENQAKIENILSENKISVKSEEINDSKQLYTFYANFFQGNKKNNTERVQFIFQVLLSLLIELIAQVSIYIFIKMNNTAEIKPVKIGYTKLEIEEFTRVLYKNIFDKTGKRTSAVYLLDKNSTIKMMGVGFSKNKYKHLVKLAVKNKLIVCEKGKFRPNGASIDRKAFYNNMCKSLDLI